MIKRLACVLLCLVLATIFLEGAFRPEDVKVHTLANGLKVLLLEDHDIPNIALYTFFRVGSRNERPGLTGVSHFIEHMMFNGSPKFGPGEFDRIMEFHGGANNAYTTDDLTAYTDWFPASALEPMLEMEADRMQGLTFTPSVLESERGVIASERRMAVENNNDSLLEETVRATSIMAHPYHWEVIGWMSDILSWRRDEVSQYYRTYYAPNNAVMIVVGDFDTSRALEQIKKYFGPIAASAPPPPVTTTEPPQLGPRQVLIRKEAQAPCFLMVYHAPAWKEADFPALFVLEKALLQGESSRLYRRLVREEKLALYVGGGIQETIDPLLFSFYVKPRPGVDLDRIEAVIEEELAKVEGAGLTDREFQKGLNIIRSSFYFGRQTISGQANLLGSAEVLYGGFQQAFIYMDRFAGLRKEQVQEAAKKYLLPSQKTVGKLIPQGGAQ
jgi:zinc protease